LQALRDSVVTRTGDQRSSKRLRHRPSATWTGEAGSCGKRPASAGQCALVAGGIRRQPSGRPHQFCDSGRPLGRHLRPAAASAGAARAAGSA